MSAQICETCKNKGKRCYCAPNSTCSDYEELNTKHTVLVEALYQIDHTDRE